jgi:hypothetical protein
MAMEESGNKATMYQDVSSLFSFGSSFLGSIVCVAYHPCIITHTSLILYLSSLPLPHYGFASVLLASFFVLVRLPSLASFGRMRRACMDRVGPPRTVHRLGS